MSAAGEPGVKELGIDRIFFLLLPQGGCGPGRIDIRRTAVTRNGHYRRRILTIPEEDASPCQPATIRSTLSVTRLPSR
jgi:hypothetical protein